MRQFCFSFGEDAFLCLPGCPNAPIVSGAGDPPCINHENDLKEMGDTVHWSEPNKSSDIRLQNIDACRTCEAPFDKFIRDDWRLVKPSDLMMRLLKVA
jgi:hypothetical protein